jgi:hypothetical protein
MNDPNENGQQESDAQLWIDIFSDPDMQEDLEEPKNYN